MRAEVGPDARIVAANRVRKGGVGGFFAPGVRGARRAGRRRTATPPDADPQSPRPAARRPTPDRHRPAPGLGIGVRPPPRATILELADAVSDDERNDVIDLVEERSVSTESRDFAQVLDRFSRSIDATPGRAGQAPTIAPVERSIFEPTMCRWSAAPIGDRSRASDPVPHDEPFEPRVTRTPTTPRLSSTSSARRTAARRRVDQRARGHRPLRDATVAAGAPGPADPARRRSVRAQGLAGGVADPPSSRRPSVPAGLGVVIAIVGTGAAPVLLARDLADELGLDPDDVVLATREQLGFGIPAWLQMSDAATAQERRRSWRRRTRPTIVACSLPPM